MGTNGHGSADPGSDRERLIEAFTRAATERGSTALTAEDVAAAAGLAPEDFHTHFESTRQCLSAAYDAFVDRLLSETRDSIDEDSEWPQRVKGAVEAGLDFVSETATSARFFAVDAQEAGPLILERYMAAIERGVPLLREGREHYPDAAGLPKLTEPVLIGGVACLVTNALLDEEHESLPGMEKELVEILLTPYLGAEEARRISA
jgi:AcrR family transcriptional regulator